MSAKLDAVYNWVTRVTGLSFIWGNQNAPTPTGSFCVGTLLTQGFPGVRPVEATVAGTKAHGEFSVLLTVFSADYFEQIDKLRFARSRVELDTGGIALKEQPETAKSQPQLQAKKWISAGYTTLRFRFVSQIAAAINYIETMEIEGTVDDIVEDFSITGMED